MVDPGSMVFTKAPPLLVIKDSRTPRLRGELDTLQTLVICEFSVNLTLSISLL